jgi:hypothetical protein
MQASAKLHSTRKSSRLLLSKKEEDGTRQHTNVEFLRKRFIRDALLRINNYPLNNYPRHRRYGTRSGRKPVTGNSPVGYATVCVCVRNVYRAKNPPEIVL